MILGLGALGASIGFLLFDSIRKSSPVFLAAGSWAYVWQFFLLFGSLAIIFGWYFGRRDYEALGLVFVSFGYLAYVMAIILTRGKIGWTGCWLIGASGISQFFRARELTRGRDRA